jgi:plastocyanin
MTSRRRALALGLLAGLVVLVLVACGGSGSGARDASPAARGAVTMIANQFSPPHVQVPARTTVTWTNGDQSRHNVTFKDGPSSSNLTFGATFQRVFDTPGVFDYECTIHPGMVGRVTVIAR